MLNIKYGYPGGKISLPALPKGLVWYFPQVSKGQSAAAEIHVQKSGMEIAVGDGETLADAMQECLKMLEEPA